MGKYIACSNEMVWVYVEVWTVHRERWSNTCAHRRYQEHHQFVESMETRPSPILFLIIQC